jgi:hypothetical protein
MPVTTTHVTGIFLRVRLVVALVFPVKLLGRDDKGLVAQYPAGGNCRCRWTRGKAGGEAMTIPMISGRFATNIINDVSFKCLSSTR